MRNCKGFTILEVLIAGAIMVGVGLFASQFMSKSSKKYTSFQGKMLITIDINQVFHNLSIDLANLARLTDNGVEVESFNSDDKAYLGIYGFSANDAKKLPQCLYEPVDEKSGFSIIRYTTINQQRPSKLIKFWKEDSSPQEELFIHHTEGLQNQIFSEIAGNNKLTKFRTKEIIIIDGDGFTTSRLLVKDAAYVESSIDPYDNVNKSPKKFKYFKVTPKKPGTFYLPTVPQKPLAHQFITGSYVYSVTTKVLCVSKDKTKLLSIDEADGTSRMLINVGAENSTFTNFRINYLSSGSLESDPGLAVFPLADPLDPTKNRKCIDQLFMRMDVQKDQKVFNFSQNIFIDNYNLKRPSYCK